MVAGFAFNALQEATPPIDGLDGMLVAAVGAGKVDFAAGASVDGGNGVCFLGWIRHEIE